MVTSLSVATSGAEVISGSALQWWRIGIASPGRRGQLAALFFPLRQFDD